MQSSEACHRAAAMKMLYSSVDGAAFYIVQSRWGLVRELHKFLATNTPPVFTCFYNSFCLSIFFFFYCLQLTSTAHCRPYCTPCMLDSSTRTAVCVRRRAWDLLSCRSAARSELLVLFSLFVPHLPCVGPVSISFYSQSWLYFPCPALCPVKSASRFGTCILIVQMF